MDKSLSTQQTIKEVCMKAKKLLKFLCFFIAIVPFSAVACQGTNETPLNNPNRHSPKYLLAGRLDASDNIFNYYAINNEQEYAVSLKENYINSTDEIHIPDEYNSKPVTGIYRSAFYKSKSTKVLIPNSITVIDYEAFLGSRITTVTIPSSVEQIGEGAFYSCKQLTKAAIQNSSTTSEASSACSCSEVIDNGSGERTYSTLTTIPSFCFFNCVALKELVLPESIEEIEYEAFNGCSALFSTLAFMNIKAIRSRAFQNCTALKNVYISNSFFQKDENQEPIGIIEDRAFNGCSDALTFHLVGDTDTVNTWLALSRNLNRWNVRSEFNDPTANSNHFSYDISTSGASYSNDWIYTTDNNNDVEIASYIGPTDIEGVPVKFISIPNELPSGSGHYVRKIALNALDTVKASLERLYLPTSLSRIENGFFTSTFTNLAVIDDNTKCSTDESTIAGGGSLTPRIILNGITSLKVIGTAAFVNMPKLNTIKKLYLPYSLEAVGSRAFGNSENGNAKKHMQAVTDFRWDYDDELSALKVIGKEAFFQLGRTNNNDSITGGTMHQDYLKSNGDHNYELTTLVFPRTFQHFGITSTDATTYGLSSSDTVNSSAFGHCPLLSKVIFKGSKKSTVQSSPNANDTDTSDLVLGYYTFAVCESLRTVVFEERCGKSIVFSTNNNQYSPVIGWTSGKNKNDFGGDPGLQTLVLPNMYTTIRVENYAFQGNSRGAIYLSGSYSENSSSKIRGAKNVTSYTSYISSPSTGACNLSDTAVKEWRTIGDEGKYSSVYPGYNFQSEEKKNFYGIDQKMPYYANVLYKETINVPGVNVEVEVGTGNTKEYVEQDKCAFVTGTASGKATMTNYLYDRHCDSNSFSGTARVPATVTDSNSNSYIVNTIGASAFSADYCDATSYKNYSNYKDLTAVELPNTITTIGEYAFMRAYGITKVSAYAPATGNLVGDYVMPSSLANIDKHAFAFCGIQQVLNIPNSCKFWETKNNPDYATSVFSNSYSLRKVTFGNNATSSTYYQTTTYTHRGSSETYTSAIYSTASCEKNASALLLVLNRDSSDYLQAHDDLSDETVVIDGKTEHYSRFDGQYSYGTSFLYGAFKMCHWIDSLVVGTPVNSSLPQPLISGLNEVIYLNQKYDFSDNNHTKDLKSISFGTSGLGLMSSPEYAFEGCSQLAMVELPRIVDGVIPKGLFSSITNEHLVFKVPNNADGTAWKVCDEGVLDLTYTGYAGIDDEAFKGTNITTFIAPDVDEFTVGVDAFGNCTSLETIDFSKVNETVEINGSFRGATLASTMFNFGSDADIYFGEEAFKGAKFTDNTFVFPAKTAMIGQSCFESCDDADHPLTTVTAEAVLTNLKPVLTDTDNNQNHAGDTTGFKEIGNFAFYLCKHLSNFDFSKFTQVERIGHYAFGMIAPGNDGIIPMPENHSQMVSTATITTDGVINFSSNLTNLGCGAFNSTAVTRITINSNKMQFERGGKHTYEPRCQAKVNGGLNNGCHQFRHCDNLINVIFTVGNCQFTNFGYPTKGQNGQENIFSWCNSLQMVVLPTGYEIQHFMSTGGGNNDRPDSMVWGSKSTCKIYTYHTATSLKDNPFINIYWRRTGNNTTCDLVYYVTKNTDLAINNNGTWSIRLSNQQYWALKDGEVFYLGTATIDSSTGLVTFSSGATADANGVTFPS